MLATVLEEMPPFPEKESSGLLNLLKKKRPGRVIENPDRLDEHVARKEHKDTNGTSGLSLASNQDQEGGSADLLGLGVPSAGNGPSTNGSAAVTNNIQKFYCKNNGVLYENEIIQVLKILFYSNIKRYNPRLESKQSVAVILPGWRSSMATRLIIPSW